MPYCALGEKATDASKTRAKENGPSGPFLYASASLAAVFFGAAFLAGAFLVVAFAVAFFAVVFFAAGFLAVVFAAAFLRPGFFAAFSFTSSTACSTVMSLGSTSLGRVAFTFSHLM